MKKLLLTVVLVFAAAAIFLGPPLRSAFAATEVDITLGRAPMHPTQAALDFMLDEPGDVALTAKKKPNSGRPTITCRLYARPGRASRPSH